MNPRHIEELVTKAAALPDESAREVAIELVQAVLELHRAGLERVMQILAVDQAATRAVTDDELVSSLLLLHDLHPVDMETRVRTALGSHGKLVSITNEVVRVRATIGLRQLIESVICEKAPDAVVIVEDERNFVPLTQLKRV